MLKNKNDGWVYFIKCGRHYKIGVSKNNIRDRIMNYKTHNPGKIKLIQIVYVQNCLDLESSLILMYMPHKNGSDWCVIDKDTEKRISSLMLDYQREEYAIPDYKLQLTHIMY